MITLFLFVKGTAASPVEGLVAQVPATFQFTFKVTDHITLKRYTNLPRFGLKAGQPNPDFLNAELFQNAFLSACEPCRDQIGLLMFEFSKFYPSDFERGRDFVEALDGFLGRLPSGWRYGVEIRNRHFLKPEYFATLATWFGVDNSNLATVFPNLGRFATPNLGFI